ncbi:hypothetical protein MSAN_02262000 [Mycena sanguinolenta]|uniref:Uncharacterized protein n=1 Tax=Mycena sanguinolenta TaxID=230812 RepID=A0A8H7CIB3_9AGAR|nr:hypothetical protein MSAN_02262000 [Mycena sanguinolenta]
MDDCCGICCICVACFGCIGSAFRYIPFQFICRCCRRQEEEEDYENMKFPEHEAAFTPDGQRIHPYTPPMQMQALDSQRPDDPHVTAQARPVSDYTNARDAIRSDSEEPLR